MPDGVDAYSLFLIAITILLIAYLILDTFMRKPKKKEYVTRELLKCAKCGLQVEREFEPGDFIGLAKDKCPKCGGELRVEGIYSVEKEKVLKAQ
ncbi:MAG: hypothetical protein QXP68_07360 [Thermosphaera sp.]